MQEQVPCTYQVVRKPRKCVANNSFFCHWVVTPLPSVPQPCYDQSVPSTIPSIYKAPPSEAAFPPAANPKPSPFSPRASSNLGNSCTTGGAFLPLYGLGTLYRLHSSAFGAHSRNVRVGLAGCHEAMVAEGRGWGPRASCEAATKPATALLPAS